MNCMCEYYVKLLFKSNLCFKSSIVCLFKHLRLASNVSLMTVFYKNDLHYNSDIQKYIFFSYCMDFTRFSSDATVTSASKK